METMLTNYKFFKYQVDTRTFNTAKYLLRWAPKKQSLMTIPEVNDHIKLCSIDTDNWVTQEYVISQATWYDYDGYNYGLTKVGED